MSSSSEENSALRDMLNKIIEGKIDANRRYVDEVLEKIQDANHRYYLDKLVLELTQMEAEERREICNVLFIIRSWRKHTRHTGKGVWDNRVKTSPTPFH